LFPCTGVDSTGSSGKSRHNSGGICYMSCCYSGSIMTPGVGSSGPSYSAPAGGALTSDTSSAIESGMHILARKDRPVNLTCFSHSFLNDVYGVAIWKWKILQNFRIVILVVMLALGFHRNFPLK